MPFRVENTASFEFSRAVARRRWSTARANSGSTTVRTLASDYIASGGDRDFMRPIAGDVYGIPAERVIGSALGLTYQDDGAASSLLYKATMDFFDDGPEKPVRIWSRIGRRPIFAFGNSNGDVPMLAFSGSPSTPSLRLLLLHDHAADEFDYVAGAEDALGRAKAQGWTVVSMKNDWERVFATSDT